MKSQYGFMEFILVLFVILIMGMIFLPLFSPGHKKAEKVSEVATEPTKQKEKTEETGQATEKTSPCLPKYKVGDLMEVILTGYKGQIYAVIPNVSSINNTCIYKAYVIDDEGNYGENEYYEFELRPK